MQWFRKDFQSIGSKFWWNCKFDWKLLDYLVPEPTFKELINYMEPIEPILTESLQSQKYPITLRFEDAFPLCLTVLLLFWIDDVSSLALIICINVVKKLEKDQSPV